PFREVAAAPGLFITNVCRCTKDGWIGNNMPLYEEEYVTLAQAREGHTRVLEQLAKSTLKSSAKRRPVDEMYRWIRWAAPGGRGHGISGWFAIVVGAVAAIWTFHSVT